MTTAHRNRLAGISALLAGARLAGRGVVTLDVTADEVAPVRELVTAILGREQDTLTLIRLAPKEVA